MKRVLGLWVHCSPPSVGIVNELGVERLALLPPKQQSPLIVDSNRVETSPVAGQCFKTIPGWHAKIVELRSIVQVE